MWSQQPETCRYVKLHEMLNKIQTIQNPLLKGVQYTY